MNDEIFKQSHFRELTRSDLKLPSFSKSGLNRYEDNNSYLPNRRESRNHSLN